MRARKVEHYQELIAAAFAFVGVISLGMRLGQYQLLRDPPPSKVAAMVPAPLFKTLTFGQWTTGIDWMWIRALTDSSLARVARGEHPELYYSFMMATELDPAFFFIYFAGGNLLAVIRDDGMGARDLVARGNEFRKSELPKLPDSFREKQWRTSWQLPMLLAYIDLFELNDMRAASVSFVEASQIPGAPAYLQSLAHRFEKPGGQYEVGLRLINFMISGEKDSVAKEKLEAKRQGLFIGQFLFHLRKSFAEYLDANSKYHRSNRITPSEMNAHWLKFLKETRAPSTDPLGGKLMLDESGRVVTTTPHPPVFGLE